MSTGVLHQIHAKPSMNMPLFGAASRHIVTKMSWSEWSECYVAAAMLDKGFTFPKMGIFFSSKMTWRENVDGWCVDDVWIFHLWQALFQTWRPCHETSGEISEGLNFYGLLLLDAYPQSNPHYLTYIDLKSRGKMLGSMLSRQKWSLCLEFWIFYHWIGFVRTVLTGNHGLFPIKYRGIGNRLHPFGS